MPKTGTGKSAKPTLGHVITAYMYYLRVQDTARMKPPNWKNDLPDLYNILMGRIGSQTMLSEVKIPCIRYRTSNGLNNVYFNLHEFVCYPLSIQCCFFFSLIF